MADKDDFYLNAAMNTIALFCFGFVPLGAVFATGYVIAGWDGVAVVLIAMSGCFLLGAEIESRRVKKATPNK